MKSDEFPYESTIEALIPWHEDRRRILWSPLGARLRNPVSILQELLQVTVELGATESLQQHIQLVIDSNWLKTLLLRIYSKNTLN